MVIRSNFFANFSFPLMYRLIYFILVLLLSGISGCFYSDSEMFYVVPLAGDPTDITVSTNLDDLHNPQVNDSLEVRYLVEITDGELYYAKAALAGSLIYGSDTIQGAFWITPYMADAAGIDTLYMRFEYSSNTNSLADKISQDDNYEVVYEWLVKDYKFALDFNLGAAK